MKPRPMVVLWPVSVLLLVSLHARLSAQDWQRYGHDGALTGRCPVPGDIAQPNVSWSFSTAGTDLWIEMVPHDGQQTLQLSHASRPEKDPRRLVPAAQCQLDVDGSGTTRPVSQSHHQRWARILPDLPGYQQVAWNYTWTDQAVCRLQLFAYDQGYTKPRLVWETDPPEGTIFNPLNIVYDIDQDGVQEVCVAAHYRVMIFEGTTGRKETELRYHTSRPYGWFGLADLDGDGQQELITVGDFQSHIDVLEFDNSRPEAERLSVKWRRDIEQDIEKRTKWPQVGPLPVVDVNGDGRGEIVLNMFNDLGDRQWHVVVLDGCTGETTADLPRRYFLGASRMAEHGSASLFVTSTNGVLVHRAGDIELVQITEHGPRVFWHRSSSAWCTADLPQLGSQWSTSASQGMQHVLLSGEGRPVFFVKTWDESSPEQFALTAWQSGADDQIGLLWQATGLPNSTTCVPTQRSADSPQSAVLLRAQLSANRQPTLACENVQPRVVQSETLGIDVSMPVVAKTGQGVAKSIIVEGPGQEFFSVIPPHGDRKSPALQWQRPGRGMRDGSRTLGLLATDLDGDGVCELLAADQALQGHAILTAYRGDGSVMWRKPFEQTPGDLPVWNIGALTFWWDGQFREPGTTDVLVNVRRGLMHSDVGYLLEGKSGATLWTQEQADVPDEFHWGFAGTPLARVDVTSDQRDELVCLHPVCFWIADGRDGTIILGKELASRKMLPAWAAYGEPMAYDFDHDGSLEILLDSPYILALLELDGSVVWHGSPRVDFPVVSDQGNVDETTQCKHALVDIDEDGRLEIASAGYGNGVRVIDPCSGSLLWSLDAPKPNGPKVSAANVDGIGGDEIVYSSGATLVAITGDGRSGRILWQWQAPAALGMPAIADVDGDGKVEIVVQDAQATIHCLDGRPADNEQGLIGSGHWLESPIFSPQSPATAQPGPRGLVPAASSPAG